MRTAFLAAAAIVLLPLVAGPAQAEPRVAELMATINEPATRSYIVGLAHGTEWASVKASTRGGLPIYCPPSALAITDDQHISIFSRYATSKQAGHRFAGQAMLFALIDAFPCPATAPR